MGTSSNKRARLGSSYHTKEKGEGRKEKGKRDAARGLWAV